MSIKGKGSAGALRESLMTTSNLETVSIFLVLTDFFRSGEWRTYADPPIRAWTILQTSSRLLFRRIVKEIPTASRESNRDCLDVPFRRRRRRSVQDHTRLSLKNRLTLLISMNAPQARRGFQTEFRRM